MLVHYTRLLQKRNESVKDDDVYTIYLEYKSKIKNGVSNDTALAFFQTALKSYDEKLLIYQYEHKKFYNTFIALKDVLQNNDLDAIPDLVSAVIYEEKQIQN